MALRKPVITGATPAVREIFLDRKHLLLCEPANARALADLVVELLENKTFSEELALNGFQLVTQNYDPHAIGTMLVKIIQQYRNRS
jgi:glycosyltransferase involved in cell wall biosynthesis